MPFRPRRHLPAVILLALVVLSAAQSPKKPEDGLVAVVKAYLATGMGTDWEEVEKLIMWVNHHELMRLVGAVEYPFLFANGPSSRG